MKTPPAPIELLTANQIAKRLERSTRSVIDAIHRNGIQHSGHTGHFKLYPPGTVETVRNAMRAPNQAAKPATTGA